MNPRMPTSNTDKIVSAERGLPALIPPNPLPVLQEIHSRLEELKKPHWSGPWTFWVALAAALIALGAWLFPRTPSVPAPVPASLISQPVGTAKSAPVVAPPNSKAASAANPSTQPNQ